MNNKGLTLSMVFQAQSANYGESIGNISQLKKMTRADGKVYTYISRQALRYSIVQQMGIDTPVDNVQKVVQFSPETTILDYPEIDLFGYMKTKSSKSKGSGEEKEKTQTRSAVVRLSNAVSMEPYKSDMDFLTNMGLASRKGLDNALAQSEIHNSLYAYTITIDLDEVGIDKKDGKDDLEVDNAEKAARVQNLLDTIQFLYRDIRGRRENLNPLFVVGGVYDRKNPYFEDRLHLQKGNIDTKLVQSIVDSCEDTKQNTHIGVVSNYFSNDAEIQALGAVSISEVFQKLKEKVADYYA